MIDHALIALPVLWWAALIVIVIVFAGYRKSRSAWEGERKRNADKDARLEISESENSRLKAEIRDKDKTIVGQRATIHAGDEAYYGLMVEYCAAFKKVQDLENDNRHLKDTCRVLEKDKAVLQESVRALENDNADLREDVRVLENDYTGVSGKVCSLENQMQLLATKTSESPAKRKRDGSHFLNLIVILIFVGALIAAMNAPVTFQISLDMGVGFFADLVLCQLRG